MSEDFIPWWRTSLDEAEARGAYDAILAGHLSQGPLTQRFEAEFSRILGVPYAVATPNGTSAITLALKTFGIGCGDEVIVPNRTFIATGHAVLLVGAKVKLVDTRADLPVIDETKIEAAITKKTKAILPVHVNGHAANMDAIQGIARRHGLKVIEDAAQAFTSRCRAGYLGTLGDLGCFSFAVTKLITTGQGGIVVTRDKALFDRMTLFRNQGVDSVFEANFDQAGYNYKFSDILAAVGLAQLKKLEARAKAQRRNYRLYARDLAGVRNIRILPVNEDAGEIPLWIEALSPEREKLIAKLAEEKIQVRPFPPDLSESPQFGNDDRAFVNSKPFARQGMFLPCGPDQAPGAVERAIAAIKRALA